MPSQILCLSRLRYNFVFIGDWSVEYNISFGRNKAFAFYLLKDSIYFLDYKFMKNVVMKIQFVVVKNLCSKILKSHLEG